VCFCTQSPNPVEAKPVALKKRKLATASRQQLSYLQTSARLQREANAIQRERLQAERKRISVLENIHTELSLLRHAYYTVNGVVLTNET